MVISSGGNSNSGSKSSGSSSGGRRIECNLHLGFGSAVHISSSGKYNNNNIKQ